MYHGVDAVSRKPRVNDPRQCVDPKLKPVRQSLAYNVEGQIKGQQHYAEKDRYSCVAPSEYLIYTYGARMFFALMALYDGVLHNVLNERIAHVRKRRISVQPRLILHLHDAVLKQLLFVLVKPQFVCKTVPALDKLRRAEAGGNAYAIRMVGNKMNNGVDAAVNGRILPAEVCYLRHDFAARSRHSLIHELRHALALRRHDRHHWDAQRGTHFPNVDRPAVGAHLVHHI